ncbi:hypothetical protein H5399_09155 [Tessaracoccus sp. MC1627]|nr:hypothetical protein [Tessaracoccus sp. MC1627]
MIPSPAPSEPNPTLTPRRPRPTPPYATILAAATPGEGDKPARQTADIYRQHLQRIFLLDPIEAWTPAFAPLKAHPRPKHHLVDPALAARLIGVGKAGLLRGQGSRVHATTGTWLGPCSSR